jgi:hypothetical protein
VHAPPQSANVGEAIEAAELKPISSGRAVGRASDFV